MEINEKKLLYKLQYHLKRVWYNPFSVFTPS